MKEAEEEEQTEIPKGGGLLGGLTTYEIRMLCENPWEGGRGFTPREVGQMTLDQIWMQLCKREYLKREIGSRTIHMEVDETVSVTTDKEGYAKVVTVDGKIVKMKKGVKSVARQLMEKQQEKQEKERSRRRRRKKRGT